MNYLQTYIKKLNKLDLKGYKNKTQELFKVKNCIKGYV